MYANIEMSKDQSQTNEVSTGKIERGNTIYKLYSDRFQYDST